ncbi:MAG: hypothetical protein WC621_00305 [Patescibacteria group bacterium]
MFSFNILPDYLKKGKIQLWLTFIVSLLVFGILQFSPVLADPDSFYHARLTVLLRDFGWLREFPWTQSSLYQRIFIDHHFGYHLLLAPFVSLWPPLVGLKIATAVMAALTVTAVIWCLKRWAVRWWGIGLILLLTASPLLFRLSLGKAPSLAVGAAIIGYYLITSRQLGWLFWWSWFYVWLYSAWPLLLVMAVVYMAVDSISSYSKTIRQSAQKIPNPQSPIPNNCQSLRPNWNLELGNWNLNGFIRHFFSPTNRRLIGVIILGYAAGLVINPYFPTNLWYLRQLFTMALVAYNDFLAIGAEWYPYNPFELASNLALAGGIWFLLTVMAVINFKRQAVLTRTTWWLTLIFLAYTLRARRQVEYLAPWLVLSSGLMWRDLWPVIVRPGVMAELDSWLPQFLKGKIFKYFLASYLIILLPIGLWRGGSEAYNGLRAGFKLNKYQAVTTWLRQNTPSRSIIFQSDWSNFPVLWYNDLHNYYLTGLDQTFMYEYDRDKYWLWQAAAAGEKRNLYDIARYNFGASYILLDRDYPKMLLWLNRDKRFKKVYSDQEAIIYALD